MLRHLPEADQRDDERRQGGADDHPAMADAPMNQTPETAVERVGVGVVVDCALLRFCEQGRAEEGDEEHGDQPGKDERHADDPENVLGVFAGAGAGQPDRQIPGGGDQGAGEHRESGGGVGKAAGADAIETLLEFYRHGFDGDDGVVHQQPQGDDHGAQRDALQVDAEQLHADQHACQDERHADGNDDAGAPAEGDEADEEDDSQGLDKAFLKIADVAGDDLALVVQAREMDAERQGGGDAGEPGGNALAQVEDVAAIGHGDAQAEGRMAAEAHGRDGRLDGGAVDGGEVGQAEEVTARLDRQVQQFLHRVGSGAGADADAVVRGVDKTAGDDAVLGAHGGKHLLQGQAQLSQLAVGKIELDALVLQAEQDGLADARDGEELLAQILGHVAEFGEAETIGGQCVEQDIGVAELVVEVGALDAWREARGDVADLLSHLIPEALDIARQGVVAQADGDDRVAGLGLALGVVEVGEVLERALYGVGDEAGHLVGVGAWPLDRNDHLLDREGRIFGAAEAEIGPGAGGGEHDHGEEGERAVPQGECGEVHAVHRAAPCHAVSAIPGVIWAVPAVTTWSPALRPAETAIAPSPL